MVFCFLDKRFRFWLTTGGRYTGFVTKEDTEFVYVLDEKLGKEVIIKKTVIGSAEALE